MDQPAGGDFGPPNHLPGPWAHATQSSPLPISALAADSQPVPDAGVTWGLWAGPCWSSWLGFAGMRRPLSSGDKALGPPARGRLPVLPTLPEVTWCLAQGLTSQNPGFPRCYGTTLFPSFLPAPRLSHQVSVISPRVEEATREPQPTPQPGRLPASRSHGPLVGRPLGRTVSRFSDAWEEAWCDAEQAGLGFGNT